MPDAVVERSLYQRAMGYGDPPDATSMISSG